MLTLEGRRALVCGSSQGIGRASAMAIAAAGAQVGSLARNPDQLRAVRDTLPFLPPGTMFSRPIFPIPPRSAPR